MFDLGSLEILMIKQTCRSFAYKREMGSNQCSKDPSSIYSLEFLKNLYDCPKDNINQIFKTVPLPARTDKDQAADTEAEDVHAVKEKQIFLDFFKTVNEMKSHAARHWTDLQHYLHYVYRFCMTSSPNPEQEVLSALFVADMRNIVVSLMEEDQIQLCLRLFSSVREYTVFAHKQHQKIPDVEASIENLFYYYEAFLSATKNLCRIFPELEKLLLNTYKLGWLDFNTSIFMYYFYEATYVQNMMRDFEPLKDDVSIKAAGIYTVLTELHKLWRSQMLSINGVITSKCGSKFRNADNKLMIAHRRVLSKNFWIDRSSEEKSNPDLKCFDYQLFTLVGNKSSAFSEPTLTETGECICEDCLVIKYKSLLENNCNNKLTSSEMMKISCKHCKQQIELEQFQEHAHEKCVSKADLLRLLPDKDEIKLAMTACFKSKTHPSSVKIPSKCYQNSEFAKDPSPKIASEPPVFKIDLLDDNDDDDEDDEDDDDNDEDDDDDDDDDDDISNVDYDGSKMSRKTFYNFLKYRNSLSNKTDSKNDAAAKNVVEKPVQSSVKPTAPNKDDGKAIDLKNNSKANHSTKHSGVTFPCGHSCKLEEELKSEFKKAYQETCDHHKESKKCDCTFCEVFGTSSHVHKTNETRNRLRNRLNQRNEKVKLPAGNKTNLKAPANSAKPVPIKAESTTANGLVKIEPAAAAQPPQDEAPRKKNNNDIHGLVNFIEGNTKTDTVVLAEKKAAKKARQREKKEQERFALEREAARKAKEERRKNEERLRSEELARQAAEKQKIKEMKKEAKKKKQKAKLKEQQEGLMEETIPAMVTIKRVAGGEDQSSSPTVTITLKGANPDQDKLLYTLVNGSHDDAKKTTANGNSKKNKNQTEASKKDASNNNKKNKKGGSTADNAKQGSQVITKELRVTLTVDPQSNIECLTRKQQNNGSAVAADNNSKASKKQAAKKEKKGKETELDIPMLRLPPGITITKVDGPMANRNFKTGNVENPPYNSNIPVSKSGVIVVDTEKLIKQSSVTTSSTTTSTTTTAATGKKSKKKKNKKPDVNVNPGKPSSMVTLKNPIFQHMQNQPQPQPAQNEMMPDMNGGQVQQAAIFKNENGMVTIRSSRLQQSLTNGSPMPKLMTDLKPVLGPEVPTPFTSSHSFSESTRISQFNAQEILSGLPGIEITKVDKKAAKSGMDLKKASCHTAEVSIIPTNNGDRFNFDKDDLHYDSVFTPKDVPEDDLEPEERELEAFKRFCQQSVVPERKEKVAHLNVKELVLKKKNDKVSG